jgi:hypothetical protein
MAGSARSGAGSPSHDLGGSSRLFSKRCVATDTPYAHIPHQNTSTPPHVSISRYQPG